MALSAVGVLRVEHQVSDVGLTGAIGAPAGEHGVPKTAQKACERPYGDRGGFAGARLGVHGVEEIPKRSHGAGSFRGDIGQDSDQGVYELVVIHGFTRFAITIPVTRPPETR